MYRIFESEPFIRELEGLGEQVKRRLLAKLREHIYPLLRQEAHFGPNIKRLRNWEPPTWRYRVGDWRLFYEIDERRETVFMTAIDHRREAYR